MADLPYKWFPEGRAPSFDSTGRIRGFRSKPGAPLSPRDTLGNRSIPNNPKGGLSNATDWGNFFKGNSPTGVRLGYTPANPAIAAAANPVPVETPKPIAYTPPPMAPDFLSDPAGFGVGDFGSAPTAPAYLGNVIDTAQKYLGTAPIAPTPPTGRDDGVITRNPETDLQWANNNLVSKKYGWGTSVFRP